MGKPLLGLVALALAAGCTPKPCDEDRLRDAADALADRSPPGRRAGIDALLRACPGMPPGLVGSVEMSFAHEWSFDPLRDPSRFDDPRYVELRRTTCPVSTQAWEQALAAPEPGPAAFERCGLDRYGLLAASEPRVFEDLEGHELYAWLTSRGIDRELARQVARGLMTGAGKPEEIMAMCQDRDIACAAAFSAYGIELPIANATSQLLLGQLAWIGATSTELRFNGVSEPSGLGGFVQHRNAALIDALIADRQRPAIAHEIENEPKHGWLVTIAADRNLPFGTVADIMFSAAQAGHASFGLVALHGHARNLPVQVPEWWQAKTDVYERTEDNPAELRLGLDAVELGTDVPQSVPQSVRHRSDCREAPRECLNRDALEPALAALHAADDRRGRIHVRVERGVPYQTVISLLELARGRRCHGFADAECMFVRPSLDTVPGLRWNTGTSLVLGDAVAERYDDEGMPCRDPDAACKHHPAAPVPEAALATFARVRAELTDCLTRDEAFMRHIAHDDISILWGRPAAHVDELRLVVWTRIQPTGHGTEELTRCVAELFGARPISPEVSLSYFVSKLALGLKIPVSFEPSRADSAASGSE